MKLKLIIFPLLFAVGLMLAPQVSLADSILGPDVTTSQADQEMAFERTSGLNFSLRPGDVVAVIIETVLGLLGIIFLVLLVYAGFQWMTAEGNEEKVEKAKHTITTAIIGLIIVLAAWAITYFVFNALEDSLSSIRKNLA